MKNKLDDKLERLSKRVMAETSLESPSVGFTRNIMSRIETQSAATVYQPLISKRAWFLLALAFGLLVLWAFNLNAESPTWFSQWSPEISFRYILPSVAPSNIFMYGLFFLAVLVIIQVPIVKYYFDKRFEI